ncbi:MAG: methionyl-tRNA formyltransferase [Lachnospiraceae bacterium]|nr:methionyl-tRNA formyltransferase [Lachnospiraceae bacterium]
MRIVFMGTPDFAVASLDALIKNPFLDVVAVYTQPDKYRGRKAQLSFSPVKVKALEFNIPVYTPVKIREPENIEQLKEIAPDIIVVAAFGQILPKEILELPKYGCVNVHASLLPKYRGASPIQKVILDGEPETGVTIMQMAQGLDTGDMLASVKTKILPTDTGESLHDRLAELSGPLLIRTLDAIEAGEVKPVPQNDADSCYAGLIRKEDGLLDFTQSAAALERAIRAYYPWPGTYTYINGLQLSILKAKILPGNTSKTPGTVTSVTTAGINIQTGDGILTVTELKLQGKKAMTVRDFLNGNRLITTGSVFTSNPEA